MNFMPTRSCSNFQSRRIPLAVICAASLFSVCVAQTAKEAETVKGILQVSEAAQIAFAKSVLEQHFPENEGDRFSFLLVNRSELVVPLIESKIGSERESDGRAILGCFLDRVNSDEFDVGHGHPLGLQKQVAEILITASAVD